MTPSQAIRRHLLAGVIAMIALTAAQGQTFTILHTLNGGSEGSNPSNGLAMDRAGNLYGTAYTGGLQNCPVDPYGCGTVFKLTRHGSGWTFSVIYSFTGVADGWEPQTIAVGPDGSLYGTTYLGGNKCAPWGCGTVFRLQPPPAFCRSVSCPWTKTTLFDFPYGNSSQTVTFDQAGNIYGTTGNGGQNGAGTVWELVHSNGGWTYNVLYNLQLIGGETDAGVVFDAAGNLWDEGYGGHQQCGDPYSPVFCGMIWKLTPSGSGWSLKGEYNFSAASGGNPYSALTFDQAGNLYGTLTDNGPDGAGGVFQFNPSTGAYNLIYAATGNEDDFTGPQGAPAIDQAGNIYAADPKNGAYGYGYVFKLTPSYGNWIYTDLHDFTGGTDRWAPYGPLVVDANGNVYGANAENVIFEISP